MNILFFNVLSVLCSWLKLPSQSVYSKDSHLMWLRNGPIDLPTVDKLLWLELCGLACRKVCNLLDTPKAQILYNGQGWRGMPAWEASCNGIWEIALWLNSRRGPAHIPARGAVVSCTCHRHGNKSTNKSQGWWMAVWCFRLPGPRTNIPSFPAAQPATQEHFSYFLCGLLMTAE